MAFDKNKVFEEFLKISLEIGKLQGQLSQTEAYITQFTAFFEKIYEDAYKDGHKDGFEDGIEARKNKIVGINRKN